MAAPPPVNIYERINEAARIGDDEELYALIAEDPNILGHFDEMPFCDTPLHVAAEFGKTHFALELMTLKPSLALKLNTSGSSPMHLALENNHLKMVRGFVAIDSSLVSIKGRGRITPLHYVAKIDDPQLLSEFLFACPSSVEDLTIKCETAVHIAVKNHQLLAFKVLLGWLQRAHREDILDWKDENGNTVFHIAASINQTEVMKLLRGIVKVKAKNLAGRTAMDILQTHQYHRFPKASRIFHNAIERLLFGSTMSLVGYLCERPSFYETQNKLLGLNQLFQNKHRSLNGNDSRTVILVVAILIVTATYQAGLSPPGGLWQENSSKSTKGDDNTVHIAGQMIMSFNDALYFYIINGIAFFSSLYVIINLTIELPMWPLLYSSLASLGMAHIVSILSIFPKQINSSGEVAKSPLPFVYPVVTRVVLYPPIMAFYMNKRRRQRVDFPAWYFSSSQELP